MATGDVTVFNEAKLKMIEGDWGSTDPFYLAIVDETITPTAASTTPTWSDFSANECPNGTYAADGTSLGTLATLVTDDGGTGMKFDSATNPTWAVHASHTATATWGIIYNSVSDDAVAYVELGTVDMSAGDLTVTWSASGIFTID